MQVYNNRRVDKVRVDPSSIGRARKKQLFTGSIAMLYCQCSYAAPLVPECYTSLVPFFLFIYLIASPLAYWLIDSMSKADGT